MMSKEKRRVPKLRFPGFTEDWEQRKLGDFYTFKNGLNKEKVYFGYGDSIINFTDVFHNRQIYSSTLKGKVFVNKKELENFKVKEGDLFFTRTSETIDEIGFPAVVMEPMERVVFSGFVLRGRAEKNDPLVNIFKSYIFFTDNFRSEMKKKSSMTTRALTSGTALKEMYFSYPKDLEEQTKIGEILLRLDNVITLHQRKLDNLKLKKKALLQKLFPKNGERYPKLRFPGFTDAWEQRKLSDISTKVTTKNVDVYYTETLTNSAEQGIISQVDFFDKEISNKDNINGYYIVDNNDFIYNPRISTLAPVGPINRNKLNRTGIMSPLYTVFRSSNVDLGFLEWYFQSSHWHRYMKLNGDSGARADRIAIKDSTFFEMPIKIPVNIKEQVLIGETLEKFNQYITLHQRKLEHLQIQKKSLLQKLFV